LVLKALLQVALEWIADLEILMAEKFSAVLIA